MSFRNRTIQSFPAWAVTAWCLRPGTACGPPLFIVGWLVTLPLWLVPGLGIVLPLFWMAWLNRRTFAYDALSLHATREEWLHLRRQRANVLIWLGLIMALLTHVPLLGLFAPSLAALAYIHFCLEALRRLRQGAIVAIHSDVKLAEKSA